MQFTLDASLASYFPYLAVAWVRIRLAPTACANTTLLTARKQAALESLLQRFPDEGKPTDWSTVATAQQWLDAYKAMGLKVKKTKPTHVALATRLIKQRAWPPRSIGPLVDTYLVNQIHHLMPHGGFDVASIPSDANIELLRCDESLPFQPMGVQADDTANFEHTNVGEVIYRLAAANKSNDSDTATSSTTLTRFLNYRDGESTKIVDDHEDESKSTKDFILIIESVDASEQGKEKLWQTAHDLEALYKDVYGDGQTGVQQSYVRVLDVTLDKDNAKSVSMSLDW